MNNLWKNAPAVTVLLAINILLFLPGLINPDQFTYMIEHFGLYYIGSPNFQYYQLVTHMFMHGGVAHLMFNMFALLMFGGQLEYLWKTKRFLIFYFATGLGAVVLHQVAQGIEVMRATGEFFPNIPPGLKPGLAFTGELAAINFQYATPVVGASGAIYGLLLGYAVIFPNAKLIFLLFPVPIKAKYLVPVMMVAELFLGVRQFSFDNIAHFAHVGGALVGFILVKVWMRQRPEQVY